nr:MAG TPA: hypothetical protein [Caudoviricetes sp.]
MWAGVSWCMAWTELVHWLVYWLDRVHERA